jgi:hypothetical protein
MLSAVHNSSLTNHPNVPPTPEKGSWVVEQQSLLQITPYFRRLLFGFDDALVHSNC